MSSYTLDQADLLIDLAQQKLHLPKLKSVMPFLLVKME